MAPRQPGGNQKTRQALPAPEPVTVSGALTVAYGFPAVKSGDVTYLIGGVNRLTGFIDGFKEGAQVTIDGKAFTSPKDSNLKFLRPSKLTLNGNSYDLSPPQFFGPKAPRERNHQFQHPKAPRHQEHRRDGRFL